MLFNQLEAIYKRYKVNGVKIRLSFTNKSQTEYVHIGAYITRTVTLPGSFDAVREQPGCIYRYLATGGNMGDRQVIKKYVNINKMLGPQAYTESSWA